jgi:hypothetical protein
MKMNMIAYAKMRNNFADYYNERILHLNLRRVAMELEIDNVAEKITETDFINDWKNLKVKLCKLISNLELFKVKIRRANRLKAEE